MEFLQYIAIDPTYIPFVFGSFAAIAFIKAGLFKGFANRAYFIAETMKGVKGIPKLSLGVGYVLFSLAIISAQIETGYYANGIFTIGGAITFGMLVYGFGVIFPYLLKLRCNIEWSKLHIFTKAISRSLRIFGLSLTAVFGIWLYINILLNQV